MENEDLLFELLHDIKTEDDFASDEAEDFEPECLIKCGSEYTDTEPEESNDDDDDDLEPSSKKKRTDHSTASDKTNVQEPLLFEGTSSYEQTVHFGVQGAAQEAKTPQECWKLFFTDEILDKIVLYTNKSIEKISDKFSRERSAKLTDKIEIKAFLGLSYLAGCYKCARLNMDDLWDTQGTGIEMFWLTMARERFRFLLRNIHFDDIDTREQRKALDKLAAVREICDIFLQQCRVNYNISQYVTIDCKLERFRGSCSFAEHAAGKGNNYGIKTWVLVDSKTFYTQNFEIYVGEQPPGPYSGSNDGPSIVKRLIKHISGTGRTITAGQFFTSFPLIENLLSEHNLTYVGAVQKSKSSLPRDIVATKGRQIGSSKISLQGQTTVLSYIPKRGKNLVVASSLHNSETSTDILTFYDKTKTAVDALHELCKNYDVTRTSRRWSFVVFYSLMNLAGINSQIIHNENNFGQNNLPRRKYLKTLSLSLLDDHLKRRSMLKNLPTEIRERRQFVAGTSTDVSTEVIKEGVRKKCFQCKKNNKSRFYCHKCHRYICLSHANFVCSNCLPE